MVMKCLVTGGAGFIGSHVAEALARRGDAVRVLDNLSTSSKDGLAPFLDKIEFMQGDIRDPKDARRAMNDVEYVFHLAALRAVGRSINDPLETDSVNAHGTLQLLIAAREQKVKRLIYASSSSVYGDNRSY